MKVPNLAITVLAGSAISSLAAFAMIERKPDHCAYCSECGAMEIKSSWGCRGSKKILIETKKIEPTPYSSMLESRKLISVHSHLFIAPRQVKDPVNEFGPKVNESLEYINSPRVVSFMANLAEFGDPEMISHWKQMTLDPKYSYVLDTSLVYVNAPTNGFNDGNSFRHWFQNNAAAFQARLSWLTTAD